MKLKLYRENLFEAVPGRVWNGLLRDSRVDCIFLTWEWAYTWWECYAPGEICALAAYDGDEIIGLAPWFVRDGVLRALGDKEVTDYLDVIARRGREEEVVRMVAVHLAADESITRVRLYNFREGFPTVELLPAMLQERGFEVRVEIQDVYPVISLPESWDAYLASLGKKQRHEVRRKMRRAGEAGKLEWYRVGPDHDLDAEMDKFLELMAASHPDKAAFLADGRNSRFFRELASVMYGRGWLDLLFLTVDGEAASACFNLVYNRRVMVYNSGLAADKFGKISAGIVLFAYAIKDAIERGMAEFDFLRGDEVYKYRMGGRERHIYQIEANRAR